MSGENELPVKTLIQMCNQLRMPCRYFFSEDGRQEMPDREAATVRKDCWQPVGWDHRQVEHTFGDGDGRIYWKDVALVMGVTAQKPHDRFLLKRRFTVTDFLKVCNRFSLSPFLFIVDPNAGQGKRRRRTGGTQSPTLSADVERLNRQVAELTGKYNDIVEKYESLLEEHRRLLGRFGDHTVDGLAGLAADMERQ